MPLRAAVAAWLVVAASIFGHVEPPFEVSFPSDPWNTSFTDSFGAPRVGHRHQGNDLMAPKHSPVYAAQAGEVVRVGEGRTPGRYIRLDHGDGWSTLYIHLNDDNHYTDDGRAPWSLSATVSEGDWVEAGQIIGYVGDSGNAEGTPPHLHFEIRAWGKAIDPYEILEAAQARAISSELQTLIEAYLASVSEMVSLTLDFGP